MMHIPSKLDTEARLKIAQKIIDDLREENNRLIRRNHELQVKIDRDNRNPFAIAAEISTRAIFVSSFLGVLAAFIRPEQLPNVLILGGWLGMSLWFISDDDFLF
ncbi:hypothetical protein [Coleofasciculus sp.]|uniref:hypothetical protein n=1 Tax=Coleofasciculus sp. TaxID=3100458 RepID=UPI0039FA3AC8